MDDTPILGGDTQGKDVNFSCRILQNLGYVYTVEQVNDVQNKWQALTRSKFVCAKQTKGFGKNNFEDLLLHHFQWQLGSLGPVGTRHKGIDYDGIPFIVIATKLFDCQHGIDRHLKKKVQPGIIRPQRAPSGRRWPRPSTKVCRPKKVNCLAQILVKDVLKFPGFRIRNNDRAKKALTTRRLRAALEENKNVVGERRFYIMLPMPSAHNGHSLTENLGIQFPLCDVNRRTKPPKMSSRGVGSFLQQFSSGMKSVQQAMPGGVDTLMIDPITKKPEPKEKEILIEVFNAGVNRLDILQRKGVVPAPKDCPVLGLEVSGRVHKLGSKCSRKWKVGDRVTALLSGGGYAEYATVHESHVLAVPNHMTYAEAAAIPEAWLTAYQLLHLIGKVSEGEYVLIHAGGSGVGTAAVQLAVAAGARPIVTAGSMKKINKAIDLGAVAGINYVEEEFPSKVLELTEGKGVPLILDCIGSAYWAKNLEALAVDGRWVLYGTLGGQNIKGNLFGSLLAKRATLTATLLRPRSNEGTLGGQNMKGNLFGSLLAKPAVLTATLLRPWSNEYKAQLVREFAENAMPLFQGVGEAPPQLRTVIDKVFFLEQVQQAHKYVEASKNIGKVILRMRAVDNEEQTETTGNEEVVEEGEAVTDHGEL